LAKCHKLYADRVEHPTNPRLYNKVVSPSILSTQCASPRRGADLTPSFPLSAGGEGEAEGWG